MARPGAEPVITIRHSAWLAWRSPPWLSRYRLTLPEEAGIGATPQLVQAVQLGAGELGARTGASGRPLESDARSQSHAEQAAMGLQSVIRLDLAAKCQ